MADEQATFFEMVAHLHKTLGGKINELAPKGDDAICITPGSDIDADELARSIESIGWFVTRTARAWIVVEPKYTRPYVLRDAGDLLFHVSETKFRDAIARGGLQPSKGGRTKIGRTYPERVFFAVDLPAAFDFIHFQCIKVFDPAGTVTCHTEDALDVYRVMVPEDLKLFNDVFFPGRAVWCEQSISPKCLELIADWRAVRSQMRNLTRSG